MTAEKAIGLIVRLQDYSETSQIATFLTDRFGRLSAIAKGAKRAKSATGGALDMLTLNEIVFAPSRSGGLATLREARTVEQFAGLRASTSKYYAGLYVAELAHVFGEGTEGTDTHLDQTVLTLRALSSESKNVDNIISYYEGQLLTVAGLAPNLCTCGRCGLRPEASGAARLSLEDGGILCRNCPGGVAISRGSLATLRRIFESSITSVQRLRLPKNIQREVQGALCALIVYHIGRIPRLAGYVMADVAEQLRKWSPPRQAAK